MASDIFSKKFSKWCYRVWVDRLFLENNFIFCRGLTTSEVSAALRPFYFTVHPDLFGKYPVERTINENSLKLLSSYLEMVQKNRAIKPTTLTFYLKPVENIPVTGSLKSVKIKLAHRDVRKVVVSILSTCDLPTTYVDQIAPEPAPPKNYKTVIFDYKEENENEKENNLFNRRKSIRVVKENQTLMGWLEENSSAAQEKSRSCDATREEVQRLQTALKISLEVTDVIWDCGWNVTHFRGCLQALSALSSQYPDNMANLKGRKLIFGNDTGLSRDGDILLNSGEVRHNWLDFIKNVPRHEDALKSVPAFEKAISQVLLNIQVVRRKFQPKTMANHYENCLRRLITSLSDFQVIKGYPKHWPETLKNFELVIESEAGPLMLSPTGQFIVPCSCPAFLLVHFITEHLETASQLLHEYQSHKDVEKRLYSQIVYMYKLESLSKDDSIAPKLMISCLSSLASHHSSLSPFLVGTRLAITTYYSVMSDGELCIPWNYKL